MEKIVDLDLNKLKKMQVNKIKQHIIDLINDNPEYYNDKEYIQRILYDDKAKRKYLKKKNIFENK